MSSGTAPGRTGLSPLPPVRRPTLLVLGALVTTTVAAHPATAQTILGADLQASPLALPMVGVLDTNAPQSQPGEFRLSPIDTNRLPPAVVTAPQPPVAQPPVAQPLAPQPLAPQPLEVEAAPARSPAPRAKPAPQAPPPPPPPAKQDPIAAGQTLVDADTLTRDDDLGVVTARGNVVVVSERRVLRADVVTYNFRQSLVTASGNVSLTERALAGETTAPQDRDTTFADYMELTDDLKDGFVRGIQVLNPTGARLSALYGEKASGSQSKEFSRGVYTACDSCSGSQYPLPTLTGQQEGPRQPPPVWQLKASRITHDEADREIVFHNAWLETFGVPILYTPYLSQPDGTVYRRSGFLPPSTGSSDTLGGEFQVPYYVVFNDHGDALLSARYTEKQNAILGSVFNYNFSRGNASVTSSVAPYDELGLTQAYYIGKGTFHLDPVWRTNIESALVTQPIYLRRLNVTPENSADYFTNHVALEGFGERSRASVEGFYFQSVSQGLQQERLAAVPLMTDVSLVSQPLWRNGHVEGSFSSLMLRRQDGTDTDRVSGGTHYTLPLRDGLGGAYTLSAGVRGDFYSVTDHTLDSGQSFTGSTARVVPQGSLVWRHPLISPGESSYQILEPKVGVFAALPDNNPDEIPNEDSRVVTLDIGNLFAPSRLPGRDRVEGGGWTSYALRYAYADNSAGTFDAEIGQSYRFEKDPTVFLAGSGLENNLSDIVARVRYAPSALFNVRYDTQLDPKSLEARRHVATVAGGTTLASASLSYLWADKTSLLDGTVLSNRNEIIGAGGARLARHWMVAGSHTYSLDRSEPVSTTLMLGYDDECVSLSSVFTRSHTVEYGIEGGASLMLTLTLKTLGSYSFSPSFVKTDSSS